MDAPAGVADQIAAFAETNGLPAESVDAAARQIARFVDGGAWNPWPEPDLEDVIWAAEALKAGAPPIREAAVRCLLADLRFLCRHAQLLDVERLWDELGRVVQEKYGIILGPEDRPAL